MLRRVLSDAPRAFGVGQDCISLKSSDDSVVGLGLPGGNDTPCNAPPTSDMYDGPGIEGDIIDAHAQSTRDGVTYRLTEKDKGTAFLQVAAARGDKSLWSVPLRFVRAGGATGELGIVATPGIVVVIGSDHTDDDTLFVVGLAEDSGVERWSRELPKRPAVHVTSLGYNNRYVLLSEELGRRAHRPRPGHGEDRLATGPELRPAARPERRPRPDAERRGERRARIA